MTMSPHTAALARQSPGPSAALGGLVCGLQVVQTPHHIKPPPFRLFVPAGETRIVWIDGRHSWSYGAYQVWLQFDPPPPPSPQPPSPPPPAPPLEDVLAWARANSNLGSVTSASKTDWLQGKPALGLSSSAGALYAWTAPAFGSLSLQACISGYGVMQLLDNEAYWLAEWSGTVDGCSGMSGVISE